MNNSSALRGYLFLPVFLIILFLIYVSPVFSAEAPVSRTKISQLPAASGGQANSAERATLRFKSDFSYENATISEDVSWKGTVIIRGYLLVAPQATLRIEQGTEIRFMKSLLNSQQPRLIIMGRIQCNGTADRPVLFAPNFRDVVRNDWGGILLLSSEKRNLLEFCRIEGATTAIEALFSTLSTRGVVISNSANGIRLNDSTATLSQLEISYTDTGLESNDSEVDVQEGTFGNNQTAITLQHTGFSMNSVKIKGNRSGFLAEESRIRVSGCEFSANEVGAGIVKGEGQLLLSSFTGNREVGLRLKGARIKVQRSMFTNNKGDAVQVEDGRSIIWGSAFSGNNGYNVINQGKEQINAVMNWWGSNEEPVITGKTGSRKAGNGLVIVAPWLDRKPSGLP